MLWDFFGQKCDRIAIMNDQEARFERIQENANGIVRRLESGTKKCRGEEVFLTSRQIERRIVKLNEQNKVLELNGLPLIRFENPRQVRN